MNAKITDSQNLVYGVYRLDELVFMKAQEAKDKAILWQALSSAKTWRDFKQAVPPRFYEEAVELLNMENEDPESDPVPDEQSSFNSEMIPGHADGDWPSWPAQEMLDWMPADIQQRFGKRYATLFNGDYLYLPVVDEMAIVTVMQERGYTCTHDDNLVRDASGFGESRPDLYVRQD